MPAFPKPPTAAVKNPVYSVPQFGWGKADSYLYCWQGTHTSTHPIHRSMHATWLPLQACIVPWGAPGPGRPECRPCTPPAPVCRGSLCPPCKPHSSPLQYAGKGRVGVLETRQWHCTPRFMGGGDRQALPRSIAVYGKAALLSLVCRFTSSIPCAKALQPPAATHRLAPGPCRPAAPPPTRRRCR